MALLFDMDGLLLDTERMYRDAFVTMTKAFGVARDSDDAFFRSLVGRSNAHTQARLLEYLPKEVSVPEFDARLYKEMRRRSAEGITLRPYVREVLFELSEAGHRMAVVTSTRRDIALEKLNKTDLLQHFEHVTGGDEVSANKPDPAPYVQTAERLGSDPRSCYAFEDSDAGITAAVRAGCIATQIPDLRPDDVPLPNLGQRVAPDLRSALTTLGILADAENQSV